MKNSNLFVPIIILITVYSSCIKQKSKTELPSSLFDSLTNQIVFVTDSSSKQTDDYNLDKSRLIFLNCDSYSFSKDSFTLRLFIDEYRNIEKKIIEINCDKNNCIAKQILFKESFDGKNYVRQKVKEQELISVDWKLFFDILVRNKLMTLPNSSENPNCANKVKDGTTYSIQLLNYSGERHYTYDNPEYYDSSCVSGIYFNKIVTQIKSLEIK